VPSAPGLRIAIVIAFDAAGQFRPFGNHVLCWVHAGRVLQKLMPVTARTGALSLLNMARDLVWRFYKAPKAHKQNPLPPSPLPAFRRRFDKIFTLRTGYEALRQASMAASKDERTP